MSLTKTTISSALAPSHFCAYADFVPSRQAGNCSIHTMRFYRFTTGAFVTWIESQVIKAPEQVTRPYVRQYLAMLANQRLWDTPRHDYTRAVKTLLKFWHQEGYIPAPVEFDMPKLFKKRLPVLTAEHRMQIVSVCNTRDKAIVRIPPYICQQVPSSQCIKHLKV